uniref:C1q domain-containing protein n=1 Tax=Pygocentrus nattereri TaxID=42514 RepID=A0A3B4EDC1_PYGNA
EWERIPPTKLQQLVSSVPKRLLSVFFKPLCPSLSWEETKYMFLFADTAKVAFSYASGLNGVLKAQSSGFILVFRKKITDVGKTYNTITGVFTAPRRGVYYFRFNLLGCSSSNGVFVSLNKNKEQILYVTEKPRGSCETASGGATLLLRKGDHVYVVLNRNSEIFDNKNNYCTFSGFLLFPM